jgi:hypothetical protein
MNLRHWLSMLLMIAVAAVVVVGCATQRASRNSEMLDEYNGHYRPPTVDMTNVMQAKMLHTQAIVEGLALGDLRQVAVNADAMHELSVRSTWFVHETVTYVALSDEFRSLMDRMSRHAREGKMDAVIEDYAAVTHSCVACHRYLRKELLEKDMPGAVSLLRLLDEAPRM